MSRMSIAAFLSKAKQSLAKSVRSKGEQPASFVIGNQSADLDSITCSLVYGYLQSSTPQARKIDKCLIPVTNIPSEELGLRPELTALLKHANLKPSDLITLDDLGKLHESLPADKTDWTLVDQNVLLGELGEHYSNRVIGVIDHHEDEEKVPKDATPRIIEKTGSCNSHVANHCRDVWDSISSSPSSVGAAHGQGDGAIDDAAYTSTWDAQVAKLALGAILIDTVNLKAEHKVTDHDRKAIKYLEAKINSSHKIGSTYDRDTFFKEINDAKSDLDGLDLNDILKKDYKQWKEEILTLGISASPRSIEYLMNKENAFVDTLLSFAQGRSLDLYAIMTAHNESGSFARQMLLIALEGGKPEEAAAKFVGANTKDLELESSETRLDDSRARWLQLWDQKNLEASRKQVAPALREAMG